MSHSKQVFFEEFSGFNNDTAPKYRKLYEILRRAIENRQYQPGEKMPSERELIRRTGLSLPTVRKAYDELMRDNYVTRLQGSGTVVLERSQDKPLLQVGIYTSHLVYEAFSRIFEFISTQMPLSYRIEPQLLQHGTLLEEVYRQFDVVIAPLLFLGEIYRKDLAYPLRSRISPDRLDYPDIFSDYLQDNTLRAMPLTWSPLVMCCNMNILHKIGFTAPEFFTKNDLIRLQEAVSLYHRKTRERVYSFPCTLLTYYRWLPFIWQNGCDIFYSENYDHQTLWESVEFLRRLYQHESCFVCPKMVSLDNEELFARGNSAFSFVCSYHLDYITRMAEANGFEYRLFEFPSGLRKITSVTSLPFTVSTYSKQKNEGIDFYRKFTHPKVQLELLRQAGFLPVVPLARPELQNTVPEKRLADTDFFFNAAVYGRSPNFRNSEKINLFSQQLGMYFAQLITLQQLKECLPD